MSYTAAVDRLHALGAELHTQPGTPRRKFDPAEMRALMSALGDPQKEFASILVAGTNGKGSTAATLASILACSGIRTGLYTSPHLVRVNERIRVDGSPIGDQEFATLFFQVDEAAGSLARAGRLPGRPSFFETVTAIGFLHFASRRVHTAVLEVGMGGRLDATNIVDPLLSIVTDISLDHTEWLGSTIAEIAREKAGVLRPGGLWIALPQHPEANDALGRASAEIGACAVSAARFVPGAGEPAEPERNRYSVTVNDEYIEIDSPLVGVHQRRNLALAIAAAEQLRNKYNYDITGEEIRRGIRETRWPARLEGFPRRDALPEALLDAAHNPAGAWALRAAISSRDRGQPLTLIFGCMKDKPIAELAQILFPLFHRVVVTPLDSPRSATAEELLAAARSVGCDAGGEVRAAGGALAALELGLRLTPENGLLVIAGSVILAGEVRDEMLARWSCVAEKPIP